MRSPFEEERRELIVSRLRWGVGAALLLLVALLALAPSYYPHVRSDLLRRPLWVAGAGVVGAGLLTLAAPVRARPSLAMAPLSITIGFVSGWAATMTGGFGSPFFWVILLIWIFGAVIVPLDMTTFLALSLPNWPLCFGITAAFTPQYSPMLLPAIICAGGYGFCLLGAKLRDDAARREFDTRMKLATNEAALTRAKLELEKRVEEQVGVIRQRVLQIEQLNGQLQQRVRERSHELSLALRKLASADRHAVVLPGSVVAGSIEVIRPLGAGGMGMVFLGTDRDSGRLVAVKMLHRHLATPSMQQRFLHEAQTTATLEHAGVIRAQRVDLQDDGQLCIILEYVDGISMDRRLARGRLPAAWVARIGSVIAEVLAEAHARGIVHRDIKPSNIMLCNAAPGVKVLDFGIAKSVNKDGDQETTGDQETALTGARERVGTPEFMSPEQVMDSSTVGPATDVYSLGVLLFFATAGVLPYAVTSAREALHAHVNAQPALLRILVDALPPEFEALIAASLRKSPDERPCASRVAAELRQIADKLGVADVDLLESWSMASDVTLAATA